MLQHVEDTIQTIKYIVTISSSNEVRFAFSPTCFLREFMSYMYSCYLFTCTYTGVKHDFHIKWRSCHLGIPLGECDLLSLQEHLSSSMVFQTSLTLYLFIDMPVPSQESELMCFGDFLIGFWDCPNDMVFYVCYFFSYLLVPAIVKIIYGVI